MFLDLPPVRIYYREFGRGIPLLFLHGGWGYEIYPFDRAIAALQDGFRILIPDRCGYGRSTRLPALPHDFHQQAAAETVRFLDGLGIERAVLWGHSDGGVIAAHLGLAAPSRCAALVLEAFHYTRAKTGSIGFFQEMVHHPDSLTERAREAVARDHGEGGWRRVLQMNGRAWLDIVASGDGDLYHGRLSQLSVPTLFLHGERDPRTEPGEIDAVRRALPQAVFRILEQAGHSPHSEPRSAEECARAAGEFLQSALIISRPSPR
ncbi:MAG: alpha/beta fold hydrolase [Acidobacteria bacterium]|nr:alpha/beta fold hydrolase [Acidobacteriota bacterium]